MRGGKGDRIRLNLLHSAGFKQAQAQLVYDLAAERVVPVIAGMAAEYEKKRAQDRLEAQFGGAERFAAVARQVKAWGERHLPKPLFETLAGSPDGIAALHHMMRAGEPRFVAGEAPAAGPTQDELDTLVRDPRLWPWVAGMLLAIRSSRLQNCFFGADTSSHPNDAAGRHDDRKHQRRHAMCARHCVRRRVL